MFPTFRKLFPPPVSGGCLFGLVGLIIVPTIVYKPDNNLAGLMGLVCFGPIGFLIGAILGGIIQYAFGDAAKSSAPVPPKRDPE